MIRRFQGLGAAATIAALALGLSLFGLSSIARADDFMAECQMGSSAATPAKACACMSEKVTGPDRVAAIAAMHSLNTTKGPNGDPPDPKALPADQRKGLDAVNDAHRLCR
jgi:hypothetical protein